MLKEPVSPSRSDPYRQISVVPSAIEMYKKSKNSIKKYLSEALYLHSYTFKTINKMQKHIIKRIIIIKIRPVVSFSNSLLNRL